MSGTGLRRRGKGGKGASSETPLLARGTDADSADEALGDDVQQTPSQSIQADHEDREEWDGEGASDVESEYGDGGDDDEEWTEEDEQNYQAMRAKFEQEAAQRAPDETWLLLLAVVGFLVCGGIAAVLPKYTGIEKDYVMASGMFLLIGYVSFMNFVAPLIGCTKQDSIDDDDLSGSTIFVVASSVGILIGGLVSTVVRILL